MDLSSVMTYNTTVGCDSGKASGKKWGISSTVLSPLKNTAPVLKSGVQATGISARPANAERYNQFIHYGIRNQ